jgi:glycosyltransferase involved in cell wall biosynthesis
MNIVLINIAFRDNNGSWIPLPPNGYGGIQWYVYHIMRGYLSLGHKVWLLGAPTTKFSHKNLSVENVAKPEEISSWLIQNLSKKDIDIIHDHTNRVFGSDKEYKCPVVSTHHFTGVPKKSDFNVFVSYTQRFMAQHNSAEVIRIPVNYEEYNFSDKKEEFLLYIGRISEWKGVYEAAYFAYKSSLKLKIAGPVWEQDYFNKILSEFPTVEYLGEIRGEERKNLIAQAKAVLVFSISVDGPWGDKWSEPGSTVVSEAAVSGTPVISSDNGCLKEIVPLVGKVIKESEILSLSTEQCKGILKSLPNSHDIRSTAIKHWGYISIANEYINYFGRISSKSSNNLECIRAQLYDIGAVKVPNFFSESELSEIDKITNNFVKNWKRQKGVEPDYWWFNKDNKHVLFRIHNLEKKHDKIKELTLNDKLVNFAKKIIGKDCTFTECALVYKASYLSAAVPWHKDPVDTEPHRIFNFSIYLDYSDKSNGALEIVPKSHLTNKNNLDRDTEILVMDANPGDVIIHDVRVFHGSAATNDPSPRRSIVIEFRGNEKGV